jgi:hypothetical protein
MASHDRRAQILNSSVFNGVDFVEIASADQTSLRVHFLNAVDVASSLTAAPRIAGGETIPTVAVQPIAPGDWSLDDSHLVLNLSVATPGDFSFYTLTLAAASLDPFFGSAVFSFKAGCASDVDCAPTAPIQEKVEGAAPAIDYLARDFLSFRQALLDFSTQNYPNWQERSEADFGVMFLEALSALGDEFSYLQDRIAVESNLATATQRRSVQRHARLVDYDATPTLSARAMLQFDVDDSAIAVPPGVAVIASGPDGTPIVFETGLSLADAGATPARALWNRDRNIQAYWLDDSAQALPAGATSLLVAGHGHSFDPSQSLLIETAGADPLDPPIRQLVRLLPAGDPAGPWSLEDHDAIFGVDFTRIAWSAADALSEPRDLARTIVVGNLVPATQGQTFVEAFSIGPTNAPHAQAAIEREGPSSAGPGETVSRPAIKILPLANAPAAWLTTDGGGPPQPEIRVVDGGGENWTWKKSLLAPKVDETQKAFTLEPATYRPLDRNSDGSVTYDYDGDSGGALRFGDGVFGVNPPRGTSFTITYRVGAGAQGNVASGAITRIDPGKAAALGLIAASNPFPATGGCDAQSLLSIRRLAPQAFRAVMLRAVLPRDYAAAAQSLPWVKRAGCAMRWTGSWLTTFTTPEPVGSEQIQTGQRIELIELLNRYRMAGAESYVPDPNYFSIDLAIDICAQPDAFAAQVKQAAAAALTPNGTANPSAFFAVSRFGFGEPLYRAALAAAVQAAPGVAGVTSIRYRLRDRSIDFTEMGDSVLVAANQILRCDNDPSRPGNGALYLRVGGGR